MQKCKLAVIGPGLIGKKHIELIRRSNNAELVAIVAPISEENIRIAHENDVPIFSNLEDCLKIQELQGVIISSPNEFHFEQASTCVRSGLPVLIEKPVTVNLDEGKSLLKLARENNSKILVGHHRNYSPLLATAKSAINSGCLGRIVSVIGSAQFYKPAQYFIDGPWRTQKGGGPILINMIHEVGNLRTLVGEISAVQSISSSNIRNFEVEDTVAINFVFKNGALGTFLLSDTAATAQSWELTSGENPSYPNYPQENCYSIAGTLGSISIPSMSLKYYDKNVEPSWWSPFVQENLSTFRDDPLRCQLEHFVDVILNNTSPLVSVYEGYRNLLITEAIRKSILTKSLIEIED